MNLSIETRALGWALLAAVIALGSALLAATPIKALTKPNASQAQTTSAADDVTTSPALVEQGHQVFITSCVECHGDDAHGDEGPDLHNLTISNDALAVMIKKGEKDQMPAFAKKYNDAQIAAVVSYLRSLH